MKVTLIGIMRGHYEDKNGKKKEASTLYFTQPYSEYESKREGMEAHGFKTGQAFFPRIVDAKPNDVVDLIYEPGFQDKATLVDVIVQKAK